MKGIAKYLERILFFIFSISLKNKVTHPPFFGAFFAPSWRIHEEKIPSVLKKLDEFTQNKCIAKLTEDTTFGCFPERLVVNDSSEASAKINK